MQILIDIPDRLIDNESGYTDIRLHKDIKHINSVTTSDYENPYFAFLSFVILPEHHGRLVDISPYEQKEAFSSSWILTRKIGQIVKNEECIPLFELPTVIETDKDGEE